MTEKTPVKTSTPSYSVPALDKGLDILEALAAAPSPLSLAELARDLNRGSAEIFRMLVCLERRAYLRRDAASGKYSPTLRMFELAQAHSPLKSLMEVVRQPMREVAERLGENCHLCLLERGKLLVVASEDSPANVRLAIEVGGRFDPEKTASGRLLLSPNSESMEARDETIEGVDDVAVRIGRPNGAVHAALAVSWLRSRKDAQNPVTVLSALRAAAKTIHQSLGI